MLGQHSGDATGPCAFSWTTLAYFKGDQRVCGRARLDIPAVGAAERRRRYNKPALGTLSARLLLLPHLFEDAIACEIGGRTPSRNILSPLPRMPEIGFPNPSIPSSLQPQIFFFFWGDWTHFCEYLKRNAF